MNLCFTGHLQYQGFTLTYDAARELCQEMGHTYCQLMDDSVDMLIVGTVSSLIGITQKQLAQRDMFPECRVMPGELFFESALIRPTTDRILRILSQAGKGWTEREQEPELVHKSKTRIRIRKHKRIS